MHSHKFAQNYAKLRPQAAAERGPKKIQRARPKGLRKESPKKLKLPITRGIFVEKLHSFLGDKKPRSSERTG